MKVSEKQLMMLLDIAKDTLRIAGYVGGYDPQTRLQMVNEILNQQSNEPREVDDECTCHQKPCVCWHDEK